MLSSEWIHQIRSLEHSLHFFNMHFSWTLDQLSSTDGPLADSPDALFFQSEVPEVLREARESLTVLKMLYSRSTGPTHR